MAHITEIKIEGLLGREDPIHLKLNRDLNIFFGENGCGKTTLLKVLDAALSRDGSAMHRLPVTKATIDIYSIQDDKTYRHTWERRDQGQSGIHPKYQLEMGGNDYIETDDGRIIFARGHAEREWKLSPVRRQQKNTLHRWSHTFLATTRLYFGDATSSWKTSARPKMSEAELDQAFGDSVNKAWLQFYSQNLAEVRDIQESGLMAVLRHVLNPVQSESKQSIQDIESVYNRVASFLARQKKSAQITLGSKKNFKQSYDSNSNLRQIVDNLDEVERRIESTMIPINKFIETISQLFSRGKTLKLSGNEIEILLADGRALPVSQMSSGEKHLIKILLACMTAGPNSILIDEPELSMHIDWQRQLPSSILSLNPSCQLILASHSPEVMADVPDHCIFKV